MPDAGDYSGDGHGAVGTVLTPAHIALGSTSLSTRSAGGAHRDGSIALVHTAMNGARIADPYRSDVLGLDGAERMGDACRRQRLSEWRETA